MTVTAARPGAAVPGLVTFTLDGVEINAPKGTLVIRAAESVGVMIPRFCDHPLLDPAGACRQCLVEVALPDRATGELRPMPKPQTACTLEVTPGMAVRTQHTSAVADQAQHGVMELLLMNHPLDCPVCDKGGECPLQNQAMSNGRPGTRFTDVKRTFPKPIRISSQILLDRERCILCQRCTRFSKEIAGDPFIDLQDRGAGQQIGTFSPGVLGFHVELAEARREPDVGAPARTLPERLPASQPSPVEGETGPDEAGHPFASYFSGNTIQICPVGALTSAAYRFRSRPFDLVSTPGVCEHCASGCAMRTDHRRGRVLRRLAGNDPDVNEEWSCDKGRFAFHGPTAPDRLTAPLVRDEVTGDLVPTSWPDAIDVAARGLAAARDGAGVGVLVGGRVCLEDAYGYAKLARAALDSNDVDFRARPHSAEEAAFLAAAVAGGSPERGAVTYADLEAAPAVLLAGLEPEEESPIVFLRLRKAVRKHGLQVFSVAPFATRGLTKLAGAVLSAAAGTEAEVLDALVSAPADTPGPSPTLVERAGAALRAPGSVLLVGERLAGTPGALSSALRLAAASAARVAWVPRRAGERGAVEAGALPGLLPGGRLVDDPVARVDLAATWGVPSLPAQPGRDTSAMVDAARRGELDALLVGGVDPADLPDPQAALAALDAVGFLVSLEVRAGAVTERADVVLPVAPPQERSGTFLSWEGRARAFGRALHTSALPDVAVLDLLGAALGVPLGLPTVEQARQELTEVAGWDGPRPEAPDVPAGEPAAPKAGEAVLATWSLLLDLGRGQDGEPYLAGTAHRAMARLSPATAAEIGLRSGTPLRVSRPDAGEIVLPVVVTDMPDRVVWLPTNSRGSQVRRTLRADAGDVVTIRPAGPQ